MTIVKFPMLARLCRPIARSFSTASVCAQKAFLLPQEYVDNKKQQAVDDEIYHQQLLDKQFEYRPQYATSHNLNEVTSRPIPINVEILKYKPIRLPQTHGDEVAAVLFRGYDEDLLIRAAEFASRAAFYLGIPTSKIITNKTEKRLYTVIKSPFAQAKTKQNFHRVTYNRKLTAYDADPEVLDLWLSFVNKHAVQDVEYKATITTQESLAFNDDLDAMTEFSLPEAYSDTTDPIAAKVQQLLKSDTFKHFLEGEGPKTQ